MGGVIDVSGWYVEVAEAMDGEVIGVGAVVVVAIIVELSTWWIRRSLSAMTAVAGHSMALNVSVFLVDSNGPKNEITTESLAG